MSFFESFILGVLEGLTEFLPVSSTGHLILASHLMGIDQDAVHKSYEVVIQLGSIFAVIVLYFRRLISDMNLLQKLAVAFVPTGVLGFLFYKQVKALFAPETVAYMLIIGGVVFLVMEFFYKKSDHAVASIDHMSFKQAFFIGFAQAFSMIPGTSRSGATIIGGLFAGLDRRTAVEFSFLLAVPTMIIATVYDVYKNFGEFQAGDFGNLAIGFITAFVVAMFAIQTFIKFVSRFNFVPFAIYRIAIGAIFLFIIF